MSLSLQVGSFSYLEESFVSYLTTTPPGPGRRVAVVTASQRMAERLQRLLSAERGLSLFNIRFHTLNSLALDVLRLAGGPLPTVINDDLFHERVVERILLKEYQMGSERARALAGAYRSTLRDLVEAGVVGSHFREHFSDLNFSGKEKLDRLIDMADAYRARLDQANVAGSADVARRAAIAVESDPALLSVYDEFLYYGFYDLNGAQSDFFRAMAQSAPVTLFFPCVKGSPGWSFAERFLDVNIPWGGARIQSGTSREPRVLGVLADRIFDPGFLTQQGEGNVRILNVSGERDEVWRVAKEILTLREGSNPVDWNHMGVVARGVENYTGLVHEIFFAHGIPFSLTDGGPLLAKPAARFALNLAGVRTHGHDRTVLLDLLSSPLLRADLFTSAAVREARSYLITAGPRAGFNHLLAPAAQKIPALAELFLQVGGASKGSAGLDFDEGERSWKAHADALREQWQRLVDPSVLDTLDPVSRTLDSLAELDRFSPPVKNDEFVSAFSEALRQARADGTGPVQGVRVMGAMDARGESFRVLFLIGLKEGVFPRVIREDPLLNDDARRFLRDPGGYWILPKREGHDEEKLLFTLLISSAQERLYLVYSRSGEEGRTEIPSLYLRTLASALGLDVDEAERVPRPPLAKWTSVSANTLTLREAALADILDGRDPTGSLGETVRRATHLVKGNHPGPWDGRVEAPEAFLDRCVRRGLSPSALETAANCPFEFFMAQVLSIREPRPFYDEEGPLPAALGSLQHALLNRVYGDFAAQGIPDPATAADHLQKEAGPFFADAVGEGAGPYPLVWRTVVDRVTRRLADFVRRDVARLIQEGARPEKLEWVIKAPMTGTDFFWNGRIDRVDYSSQTGRWTVVDYKNKIMKEPLLKRVAAGQAHQAPAYLEMVSAQGLWGPGAVCGGVRFESLTAPETDILSAEDWDKHGPALVKARGELLSKIRNGEFVIRPTDGPGSHCSLCGFARACRKAHGPTRRRALGSIESEEDIVP